MKRLALAVLALAPLVAGSEEPNPAIRAVEIQGVSAYSREAVLRILRLAPGDSLRREAPAVARTLETRYRDEGYPAARVEGSFDQATGTLTLAADEGRIAEIVVEGTSTASAARALEGAGLRPGRVLRSVDVTEAYDRLAEASDGALEAGDFSFETTENGLRIVLAPKRNATRVEPRLGGTRSARRYSRVDGLNLSLGADLVIFDRSSFNHVTPYVLLAYGLSSEHLRYAAGISRPFGTKGRTILGYEHHDLTDSDDSHRAMGLEEAHGTAVTFASWGDYFGRRGHEAYAFTRIASRAQLGFAWRSDDHFSLPVTVDDPDARPNPEIDAGHARSVITTLRFDATDRLFESRRRERDSFLQRSLYGFYRQPPRFFRGEATLEWASKESLGGDFTFRRFISNLRGRLPLPARQRVDARVLLGLSSGDLPEQKRFALGGLGTLRGYPLKAFPGEGIALATAEWSVAPKDLWPRLIVFYDGGAAWTRGVSGPGWKSDLGLGLRFPPDAAAFLRIDFARAVGDANEKRVRTGFRLQIPI